jgi:hypothetical protein
MIDDASKRPRWRELQSKVAAMFNRYRGVTAIENHTLHGARGKVAVDVYVKHDFGPLSFSIIVECKCWGTRVPQEKAHALKSVVEDVGASMGIILTEKGVQSGCAIFLAKSTNLSAYRLKELESLFERAFPNVKGIEQLEDAIEGEQSTEAALARLFEDNPHILLNLGYQKIISQPSLQPSDGGSLRPDFVLMPTSGKLCDILELRLPRVPLMTGTDQRRRFSTSVHHAINVLRHYEDHFKDPRHRQYFAQKYGMLCYRPRLLLLAGRSEHSDESLMRVRDIELEVPALKVITYDLLLEAAKSSLVAHLK